MDTQSRVQAAQMATSAGVLSPNEARSEWFGLGPVPGGETPYRQQQDWPLSTLAKREPPTVPAAPPPQKAPAPDDEEVPA